MSDSDDGSPHGNDADGRPRIHYKAESKHGYVEVCVHGAEGETVDDIGDVADERLDHALEAQEELRDRDDEGEGVGLQ